MGFFGFLLMLFLAFVTIVIAAAFVENEKRTAMSPSQREDYDKRKAIQLATALHGSPNPAFLCPHCQERGKVHTKSVTKKAGISGGKATGAILTGGVSLLATGLSRKESNTEAHCRNCKVTWSI